MKLIEVGTNADRKLHVSGPKSGDTPQTLVVSAQHFDLDDLSELGNPPDLRALSPHYRRIRARYVY